MNDFRLQDELKRKVLSTYARENVEKLLRAGLAEDALWTALFDHLQITEKRNKRLLRSRMANRIRLAKRALTLADECDAYLKLEEGRIDSRVALMAFYFDQKYQKKAKQFLSLPTLLRSFAVYTAVLSEAQERVKLEGAVELRLAESMLIHFVKENTKKPHYADVAAILNAAYSEPKYKRRGVSVEQLKMNYLRSIKRLSTHFQVPHRAAKRTVFAFPTHWL